MGGEGCELCPGSVRKRREVVLDRRHGPLEAGVERDGDRAGTVAMDNAGVLDRPAGLSAADDPVARCEAWMISKTVPGWLSSSDGPKNRGSHPSAQRFSPSGVKRRKAARGSTGIRTDPRRRTRWEPGGTS